MSWYYDIFGWFSFGGYTPTIPNPPPAPAPVAPPELSCFVKGLVISLAQDPWDCKDCNAVDWIRKSRDVDAAPLHMLTHQGVSIFLRSGAADIYECGVTLTRHESDALVRAGYTLVHKYRDALKSSEQFWIGEHAKQAAAQRAPFETLGCSPTKSPLAQSTVNLKSNAHP